MFKDKMYQELRDDLEICERHRLDEKRDIREEIETESILCSFLRKEKETDIRLVLKRHRLAIKEAKKQENKKEYEREIDKYCKDVFEYLEQNSKQFKQEFDWYCKDILGEIETHQRFDEIDKLAEKILEVRKDTSRKDSYVALQEAYLDYQLGKIDNQDMLKKAREVFTSNRKYQVTRECKEVLKDSHGMLYIQKGLDIAMIVKELLMAVLVAQAKAFLYDAGYPSFDKRMDKTIETDIDNNDTTMASVKNKGRRQDQVIDLVELYLRKKGRNVFREETDLQSQTSDYRSEEFKKRCLFIYDTIQEEGRDDVCIPMYINQNTGAGIYIIGKKWFDNTFLRNSKKMWEKSGNKGWDGLVCHFCSLYWGEIRMGELADLDNGFPVTIFVERVYGNDIDGVIKDFSDALEGANVAFREINQAAPKGMYPEYKLYFEEEELEDDDLEDEMITEDEWRRMREQDPLYHQLKKKRI